MRVFPIFALLFAAAPASAEQTPTEQTLGKIATVYVLEQTCPTMRADAIAVGKTLTDLGVSPADITAGGRYHQMMVDQATRLRASDKMLRDAGMSDQDLRARSCRNASEFYGPSGWVLKGMMVPR